MAEPGSGNWIKLHRKMADNPIIDNAELLRLWTHCLIRANWKQSKWIIPGTTTVIDVPRGAFVTGRNSFHSDIYKNNVGRKPTAWTMWRWMKALEAMGCLEIKNLSNRASMITICNYSTYQDVDEAARATAEQLMSNCRATDEQLMSTIEEDKNIRREEEYIAAEPPRLFEQDEKTEKAKKKSQRDELFDALLEVSGDDGTNGKKIGKHINTLLAGKPPYTPDEVRLVPTLPELHWLHGQRLSIDLIVQKIHLTRNKGIKVNAKQPSRPVGNNHSRIRGKVQDVPDAAETIGSPEQTQSGF